MKKEMKVFLGRLLGEVFELQGKKCNLWEGTIYGLKNGFELGEDKNEN